MRRTPSNSQPDEAAPRDSDSGIPDNERGKGHASGARPDAGERRAQEPVRPFAGRRILLGVTGGIAAYKSAWLARLLTLAGSEVDVVMTSASREFVGPITFEALTGRRVWSELLAPGHALDHIKLARAAHAIVVAPSTADFLSRAAAGRADDLLTSCLLAADAPVLLVPAMNDRMWAHRQTQANVAHLRGLGYVVIEPDEGMLAAGEGSGPGRMPEPETIRDHVGRLLDGDGLLRGRRVVVTSGPTHEALDPVRFISNRSSGKMGHALAAAAWRRGADVVLISGPVSERTPTGVTIVPVETAEQMASAVREHVADADVLVMAAAPADFRPQQAASQKIKRGGMPEAVSVAPTPDILRTTASARRPGMITVGFALETENAVAHGKEKLRDKDLDLIVVNDATEPGAGFSVDTNRVTIVSREQERRLALMPKREVADAVLDSVEELLRGR